MVDCQTGKGFLLVQPLHKRKKTKSKEKKATKSKTRDSWAFLINTVKMFYFYSGQKLSVGQHQFLPEYCQQEF